MDNIRFNFDGSIQLEDLLTDYIVELYKEKNNIE